MENESLIKRFGITSFGLHIIAMSLMLCDHLWGSFLGNLPFLSYLGRIAFPLFAFMITEGFLRTKNRRKYALRLLIFALISEIPFNLFIEHRLWNPFHQNVLFSFLIVIGMLTLYEKIKTREHLIVRLILYALVTVAGYVCGFVTFVDYFGYGMLIAALFYFTRIESSMKTYRKIILGLIQIAVMYWISCELIKGMVIPIPIFGIQLEVYKQSFSLLALPLIWLYNGRQGFYNKTIKAFYYLFYPVHMLILGLLITLL